VLPDAKRVLFTTGNVERVTAGSWENCRLTCLICVLGFFGLSRSNWHTGACLYGTQSCDLLIGNKGDSRCQIGTLVTFERQSTDFTLTLEVHSERCLLYVNVDYQLYSSPQPGTTLYYYYNRDRVKPALGRARVTPFPRFCSYY